MAGPITPLLISVGLDARGFRSGLNTTQKQLQSFAATMNVVGFRMGGAFAASFGAISAFSLKVGADFEKAMAGVRKTVDPTTTDFAKLEAGLIDASKATGIAASELADLTRIGGQLGVQGTKQLQKFTDTIAKLSIAAAELTPEAAARGLARLTVLTGESIDEVDKLASTLAFLGDKLPTTEERILNFSVLLGGMAKAANLSGEQLLGVAGGFSAVVPGTERASTAVQRLIQQMIEATAVGGPKLEEFAKVTGKSMEGFQKLFQEDAGEAIAQFIEGLARLKTEGSDVLLASLKTLDLQNLRTVQTMLAGAGAADLFRLAMDAATKDRERHAKLEREFAVQLDTVSQQFARLKAHLVEVGINLFKAFRDQIMLIIDVSMKLVGALNFLANIVAALPAPVKLAIIGVGALTVAFLGLMIAAGTMGGAVIGAVNLWKQAGSVAGILAGSLTKLKASMMATNVVSGQMALPFDKATVSASKLGGIFTKLGPLAGGVKSALAAIGPVAVAVAAGLLVGVAAADKLSTAGAELRGKTDDLAKNAINNAGIFTKAWEGIKAVVSVVWGTISAVVKGIGSTIYDNAIAPFVNMFAGIGGPLGKLRDYVVGIWEGLAITFDIWSDKMTIAWEEFLKLIGQFPDPNLDPVTDAMKRMAAQLNITIQAGEKGSQVSKRLLEAARAEQKAWQESTAVIQKNVEAKIKLSEENSAIIETLRKVVSENEKLSGAAKFLGIKEEELSKIIKEQGESFLADVAAMKEKIKADEEATKAAKALRDEINALTIDVATEEFNKYQAALVEAFKAGKEFTDEGLTEMSNKLFELAKRAGQDVTPELETLRKKFNENLIASMNFSSGIDEAIKRADKLLPTLKELGKQDIDFAFTGGPEGDPFAGGKEIGEEMLKNARIKELDEQIKEANKSSRMFGESVRNLSSLFDILGMDADSALGKVLGGIAATNKGTADMQKSFLNIQKLAAEGDAFSAAGIAQGINFAQGIAQGAAGVMQATGAGGIMGVLGGAASGMQMGGQIGGMFGPVGQAIGSAIGAGVGATIGIVRALIKTESEKITADIERDFGVKISEELAKAIEQTAKEMDLGRFESRLLHLGEIIGEAGGIAEFGMGKAADAVTDLMNSIELGAIPAEQGLAQVGEVFGMMAAESVEAGKLADAALLQLVVRARELGQEIPEIAEFISDQLAQAAAGVTKIIGQAFEGEDGMKGFGGIQVATVEDAQAQATIFSAAFFATLQEEGLLAAVDAFEPAFQELKAKLEEFGGEVDFGGVQRFFDIAKDPQFRPLLEGIGGLTEAMTGLGNAGYLTAETFSALQQQAGAAFEQLTAAGLTESEALQQIAPFLQEAINASEMFGFELDENTQKLVDQAEAAGIGFATDPMMRMVEVLEVVAMKLGATAEELGLVGETGAAAGQSIADGFGVASEEITADLDFMEGRGREAFDRLEGEATASLQRISGTGETELQQLANSGEEASATITAAFEEGTQKDLEQFTLLQEGVAEGTLGIVESMSIAFEAVGSLGDQALNSAGDFNKMAEAARKAASAASSAGGGGDNGGKPQKGQFGLATTVSVPTPFVAGESGDERVEITPGGGRGDGGGGAPSVVVLQIDGKTIGRVIGNLSRTGDVRIHPDAVEEFG